MMRLTLLLALAIFATMVQTGAAWGRKPEKKKELTEDEMLAAFWPGFKMFDQDRNARISADEITRVIGEMGGELQGSEVQHIISAMGRADIDGNRQISFPEFAKMMIEAAEEEL
mmetsp:Transcript_16351/g.42846  ORF Transcript_16351/g.42846 Transcript_16351/m.42846 type:complete len:114 (-) Transcript_16351:153-494(-)